MDVISRLPHELILLIVEEACRSYVHPHARWVASLCLLCKSVQHVVTPMLYARLFVYQSNLPALKALSRADQRKRLALVREIYFASDVDAEAEDDPSTDCFFDRDLRHLGRRLTGLRSLTGPSLVIESLAHRNDRLCEKLDLLSVTDPTISWGALHAQCGLHDLICSTPRSHIVVTLDTADTLLFDFMSLTACMARCLIIDIICDDHYGVADWEVDEFTTAMEDVIRDHLSRVRRIIFRPRCLDEADARLVTSRLTSWATEKRKRRIFVDDAFVPIYDDASGIFFYDALEVDDTLQGAALWKRGRRLWVPNS
ncbi:hypothetical protein EXIGLDRAFT_721665 [Exidia glandulosa HHB12029]|uniref:F-box domain-containing protein n=1 Tax=Exidia glandulosa HHB12029 TaxID=1314781 RepID=A0A165QCH6_EXIGL|nr:hypothetical protein EXIGLDRAFT_721665 [Exidia glandulosa HHB12029]